MTESLPPPLITPADWAATPPAVQALVLQLLPLVAQVTALQAQVADLQARLQQHSGTSSRPPSSDPPSAPPRPARPPSGRNQGGQPDHPSHQRAWLPLDQVDELICHRPTACPYCQDVLPPDLPASAPPLRQQVVDLPPLHAHVTEHQFVTVTCPHCQHDLRAPHPDDVPPGAFGPQLVALVALLHGRYRLSARETSALLADVCGIVMSTGSVMQCCATISAALEPVYEGVTAQVSAAPIANVDETGWKVAGAKAWLWVAVTLTATLFLLAPQRSRAMWRRLLGPTFNGIIGSDRFTAYLGGPLAQRQLCWAHLKRNIAGFAERDGPVGAWGHEGLELVRRLFSVWHEFRAGQRDRAGLAAGMEPIQTELRAWLAHGQEVALPGARAFSRELLRLWPALWTFVGVAGVEPTNNAAERALRPAVLWRKGSFGTQSAGGSEFVARILTVQATCRQQQRHLLTFLTQAVTAYWAGTPAPTLVSPP